MARLRRARQGPNVGWASVNARLAPGLVGDIEEGLAGVDHEITEATERRDLTLLRRAYLHKGNLQCDAGMIDEAFESFLTALDLAGETPEIPRELLLNNLSYCRVLQARSAEASGPARSELACEALRYATEALEAATDSPALAKWRCSFCSNRGIALSLLGRVAEAEEAFREGLRLADGNRRARVELQAEYADLLMRDGRLERAAELLAQAAAQVLDDPASGEADHVLELQGELAHRQGRHDEARALLGRRLRRTQDRYRERLRQVRPLAAPDATLRELPRAEKETRAELERQVRERTVALGEALLASQGAERVKEALLHNATHELRTPLHKIMGGADLLARTPLDPTQEKWRRMIHDASRDMLRQVNELLDAARLEGGEVKLESREFSPQAVLEQVRVALAPRAEKKGLALRLEVDASLPERVVGDPTRLGQALLNYGDNAIKFTAQGSVTVSARAIAQGDGGVQAHFEVLDTGIGVAREDQERLFTVFQQIDATTTRKHGGLGIGLANVAEIAGLMGGKVGMSSTPGKGSAFWLMVPFQLP